MIQYPVRPLDLTRDFNAARDVRLEGLRLHPEAFGADFDFENAMLPEQWRARAANAQWFGGFEDKTLMGIVVFSVPVHAKLRHTGDLGAMYVREAARGSGLADALVEAVITAACDVCEQVKLTVNADNARAIALYERHGFQPYGKLPNSLRVANRTYDELLMLRRVSASD